ncbi:hypothetical protein DWF00_13725 [Bosea caraganae]|uniref:Uncharacterized protein n=1 Tax=Bosea caraganae TaxID=2763117 RepID=A0A370KZI6_9HYPH|nr:hypothetical protein [Bosea caraganae]RDJ20411.1 hypothetical protein DWE98_25100 [Bosea caraganae]RDJ26508.1 hypothetical protein DWF00_13725 [Bosea caraganae]
MNIALETKPETPTGRIGNRDEYRLARQRIDELAGVQDETPEGLELAALTVAVLDYEARFGGTKDAASR